MKNHIILNTLANVKHCWVLTVRAHILKAVEVFDIYRSYETSKSPNFFDMPSNLPFSEASNRLLKDENPTNSSLEITVMSTVALQRLRKLE